MQIFLTLAGEFVAVTPAVALISQCCRLGSLRLLSVVSLVSDGSTDQ